MKHLLAILLIVFISLPASAHEDQKQSVYDRVMESGKIRCGYLAWKFFVDVDPATGEISGIIYNYMEALGQNLGLEIEWVEEVGRGDYVTGLHSNRFDVYCTAMTATAERSRVSDFVQPILVNKFNVYVQAGDTRFDTNIYALNNTDMKLIATEGDVFSKIIRTEFPKAKLIELPQLTTDADPLLYLASKKVDAIIMNGHIAAEFIRYNPDKIRQVPLKDPLRYIPVSVVTKSDEYRFTKMLDIATREMIDNGSMEKIINQYDATGDSILRVSKPYETLK